MGVAPTIIIEHREKNIFSGKYRNSRSSKSSVGAAAVGGKRASEFEIIKEKEEDEESKSSASCGSRCLIFKAIEQLKWK
jgi:hypothetical protein